MIEQIIKNVLNEMTSRLDPEQMEHLSNVLYMNWKRASGGMYRTGEY